VGQAGYQGIFAGQKVSLGINERIDGSPRELLDSTFTFGPLRDLTRYRWQVRPPYGNRTIRDSA
jgi:hypothetical protein